MTLSTERVLRNLQNGTRRAAIKTWERSMNLKKNADANRNTTRGAIMQILADSLLEKAQKLYKDADEVEIPFFSKD